MSQESTDTVNKFDVFVKFVKMYYTTLMKNPGKLSTTFYSNDSTCGRGHTGDQLSYKSAKGIKEIEELIEEYHPLSKIKILTMDWQETINNAILISTIGSSINIGSKEKKLFSHNIFLYPSEKSYFVMNDILRFVEDNSDDFTQSTDQASSKSLDSTAEKVNDKKEETTVSSNPSLDSKKTPTSSKIADNSLGTSSINQNPSSNTSLAHDTNLKTESNQKDLNKVTNNTNKTASNNSSNVTPKSNVNNTQINSTQGDTREKGDNPRNNNSTQGDSRDNSRYNYKGNYNPDPSRRGGRNRGRGNRYNNY
jgi:hypothetical protein